MRKTIGLLGNFSAGRTPLDTVAAEFGWSVQEVFSLSELRETGAGRNIVAVLFDAETLGIPGNRVLQAVREIAPKALPIVCHTSSKPIQWPELAEAGAFHALLLPFHAGEVRQSLAFVWDEQSRRRPNVVSFRRPAREHRRPQAASGVA